MTNNSSNQIIYRAPTVDDIEQLFHIEVLNFKTYYRKHCFSQKHFLYYLRNAFAIARVAEKDGVLIGYVLGIVQHGRLHHIARLYSIAVQSQHRRKGIGGRLLLNFIGEARKRGAEIISLEVAVANKGARNLFSEFAFRESDRMPDYYGRGYHGIRMRLSVKGGK